MEVYILSTVCTFELRNRGVSRDRTTCRKLFTMSTRSFRCRFRQNVIQARSYNIIGRNFNWAEGILLLLMLMIYYRNIKCNKIK